MKNGNWKNISKALEPPASSASLDKAWKYC